MNITPLGVSGARRECPASDIRREHRASDSRISSPVVPQGPLRGGQARQHPPGKNCRSAVATFSAREVVGAPWRQTVSDFEEYVAAAWPRLMRSAWVLTGDWHRAEDLVQTVLARVYGRW